MRRNLYCFDACYIRFSIATTTTTVYVPTIIFSLQLIYSCRHLMCPSYSFISIFLIIFSFFSAYSNDSFNTCFRDYDIIITIRLECAYVFISNSISIYIDPFRRIIIIITITSWYWCDYNIKWTQSDWWVVKSFTSEFDKQNSFIGW